MDLDELQAVRDTERSKDSLQELRDSFYADVADHIAELKERRDRAAERADDPFGDPEIQQLTGEIDAVEQVVESIYERRVGKLVKLASFAAADMPADEAGLTREERDLFSDLVARIEENRAHVLSVLAGEASADDPEDAAEAVETPAEAEPSDPDGEDRVDAADLMGEGPVDAPTDRGGKGPAPEPDPATHPDPGPTPDAAVDTSDGTGADAATEAPANAEKGDAPSTDDRGGEAIERVTLRITRDVGEIVGIDDREYDLASDDVVTLPEANAGALVSRDAAERLD
jgi:DNA replication factor GINS